MHCWCVLTTHFHLLVRSPVGELSEALRRSQNEYSRFFNRRHRRDGTLVRGRFVSKPVASLTYRRILVRYIHGNPVDARLVRAPWLYPWSSAAQYVDQAARCPWLERSWIEEEVQSALGAPSFRGEDYVSVFGGSCGAAAERLVESRMQRGRSGPDPLDDLVGQAPERVREWMRRKARLADGAPIGLPVCDALSIREAVLQAERDHGTWELRPNGRSRDAWRLAETGLLRTLAALTWGQIAALTRSALSSCQRRFGLHAAFLENEPAYAERVGWIANAALGRCLHFGATPEEAGSG